MPRSYIPQKQADRVLWANNFASLITANPANYGLQPADAVIIQGAADDFDAAYTIAINPTTRTNVTIAAKDAADAFMQSICRGYAQSIRNNTGVSNELKTGLGITVPATTRTPVPIPATFPDVTLVAGLPGGVLNLEQVDHGASTGAKPFGVKFNVMTHTITDTPSGDAAHASVLQLQSKRLFQVQMDPANSGKYLNIFAQWVNNRGEVGPVAPVASFVIP